MAVLFLATIASAQVPGGNIFLGYSYARADIGSTDRANLNGWNGSLEGKVFPWVGIVADVSGHYGTQNFPRICTTPGPCPPVPVDGSVYSAVFGPRVSVSVGRIRPFAHAMFGVSHVNLDSSFVNGSDTSFSSALGGGIDYNLVPAIAWRVQMDNLQTRFFSDTQNNFRLSTGIVFHF
ncbi:MAG TPA: outer membrane beta-barrel protein [Terriglobales bacterium]